MSIRHAFTACSLACLALGIALTSCSPGGAQTGTETGNPPLGFETTECKKDTGEAAPLSAHRAPDAPRPLGVDDSPPGAFNNARYQGLNCFVWERVDDQNLRIQVTNHASGCEADKYWKPSAELSDDGTLALTLDNPTCTVAHCGWCIYDLAFTVKVPSSVSELPVEMYGDSCHGDPELTEQATLPLGDAQSGEVCLYANYYALNWVATCPATERFAGCHTESECSQMPGSACSDGLSCVELEPDQPRCLPVCESDADCADIAGTHCLEGTCRL